MLIVPFRFNASEFSLMVILEPENLRRMGQNDPAVISLAKLPPEYKDMSLGDIILTAPSVEDIAEARRMFGADQLGQALRYLTRGYRVEAGDHDLPYRAAVSKGR